jgi:hypothetical protein
MGTKRRRAARHRRATGVMLLTHMQRAELLIGEAPYGSAFASDAQRRAAWVAHREVLLARPGQYGRRPWAWWQYEAGFEAPDDEAAALIRMGVVDDAERAAIYAWWRKCLVGIDDTAAGCYRGTARARVHYWVSRRGIGISDDFEANGEFSPPLRDDDDNGE